MGALDALRKPYNWFINGDLTEQEAADAFSAILDEAYLQAETGQCTVDVETPFWDTDDSVDDDAPADDQPWYGYVADPEAPPAELDFIEQAAIWGFTGLLAVATWEIGFAPAILFHTIAPKFVLAVKAGDVGEIIRILVDGQESARIDTTGRAGEVIEQTVIGDPDLDEHELVILQVS